MVGPRDKGSARLTDGLLGVKLEPYVHTVSAGLLPDCPLLSLPRASAAASAASSAEAFAAARRASRSRAAAPWRNRQDIRPGLGSRNHAARSETPRPGAAAPKAWRSDLTIALVVHKVGCCQKLYALANRQHEQDKNAATSSPAMQNAEQNTLRAAHLQRPHAAQGSLSRQSRSAPPAHPSLPGHWPPAQFQVMSYSWPKDNAVKDQGSSALE